MEKLVISVKEARKILGKNGEQMTDVQIVELIELLDILAKEALRQAWEKRQAK